MSSACLESPPFQMYGGKWEMAPWICEHLPPGQTLVITHGGAGSPLWHIEPGTYPVEVLNDIDCNVIQFFKLCREQPEDLALVMALTPYSRAEYKFCKEATDNDDYPATRLEQVRRWATVARQSMAGAWGRAWSSAVTHSRRGMASSNSRWLRLPQCILDVAARLSTVQIECMDAIQLIKRYDRPGTVFYCDPPYHPETRQPDVYVHEYTPEDHEKLLETLVGISGSCVLSGYRHPSYDKLTEHVGWDFVAREVPCRSKVNSSGGVSDRPTRTECLWIKRSK